MLASALTGAAPQIWLPTENSGKVDVSEQDHGHVVSGMGWFEVENNHREQGIAAVQNMALLSSKCDDFYNERQKDGPYRGQRMMQENKWTNDPTVFPLSESEAPGIVPFPPNDHQYYIQGIYDPQKSYLTPSAKPGHDMYQDGGSPNSAWVRLGDFNQHSGAVHVFRECGQKGCHSGRVMQGALDNGYFVEALNAVSLRPKLVKHLLPCYNTAKSIYIVRLYKNGLWHRMELDDYVPVSPPPKEHHKNHGPICCTSEHFPHVLWPSLVEKGYAKLYTKRGLLIGDEQGDTGGWEAIGAGGRVEDALVMLTGGVAGRFRTREVAADRLFVYLFEHQADTLFVCRVNQPACEMYGVKLNPYYPHAVNRAVTWEGRLYVQVFCAAPTCYDGGLEDISVPYSLTHCEEYPESQAEGFFWCDVNDFHLYFDTIIECRLTNSPACALPGMPPPRLPLWMPPPRLPGMPPPRVPVGAQPPGMPQGKGFQGKGYRKGEPLALGMPPMATVPPAAQQARAPIVIEGDQVAYAESIYANPGVISKHNAPEFNIDIPGNHSGHEVEVICSFDQFDERLRMDSPICRQPREVLLKAYVSVNTVVYKNTQKDLWKLVCKSNWLPINHSMLAFTCRRACKVKVVAEFPDGEIQTVEKAVFRCYCSIPNFTMSAAVASRRHALGELPEGETPPAVKASLVGAIDPQLMENPDQPMEFDPASDGLRRPDQDINVSWQELKQECSIM